MEPNTNPTTANGAGPANAANAAFRLRAITESLDEVPEGLRPYYSEGEDGNYRVAVDGLVPKTRLDEFRNTNTRLMQELARAEETAVAFKALGDDPQKLAEELRSLRDLKRRMEDKELVDAKGFDEALNKRTAEMKASADNQIRTLTEALKAAEAERDAAIQKHQRATINREISQAAALCGVRGPAVPDLLSRAEQAGWMLTEKGSVVLRDDEGGTQFVIGADGASPLTPKEWINGHIRDTAPHFFDLPTGGGALGSSGSGSMKNPYLKESENFTEQGRLEREKPALARQLAAAAGYNISI